MDFKKILEQLDAAEKPATKRTLSEAAFAKSGVKADAKKNKADATTRKQYFVKLANAKGGSKGVTVMADEGESESEVRSRVGRDHKSQGWTVDSIREKGDAAEKAGAGEKKSDVTASGKRRGRPPGSTKKVTEGRQTVSEYIAEARLMEKSMTPAEKDKREHIVKGMKKVKGDFEKRYPGRGEEVMYATATKRAMKESYLKEDDSMMGMTLDQAKQHPSYKTDPAFKADVDAAEKFSSSLSADKKPTVMTTDQAKKNPAYTKDPAFKARVDKTKPTTGMVVSATDQPAVAEGVECNYTMEGEECPVHGLEECGTYMEDLASMKKIAGIGAVAAAGLGAHISGENAEIRAKEVEKLEKQVASEPNAVKRGQLEKMIKDIQAGKPLSRGDIISEVNPYRYDSDVDYYDAEEAEQARLRGDHDEAEEAHIADREDQRRYDHQAAWDDMREDVEDDAEYTDEVGMVENNLETIERAAEELDSILQDGEDLPEWIEEKVSNAKAMLVAAKEYMASQHANGDVRRVDDDELAEGLGSMIKRGVKKIQGTNRVEKAYTDHMNKAAAGGGDKEIGRAMKALYVGGADTAEKAYDQYHTKKYGHAPSRKQWTGDDEMDEGIVGGSLGAAIGARFGGVSGAMRGYSVGSAVGDALSGDEVDEGNEFTGALARAKAAGAKEFSVDGKNYKVKESRNAIDELAECYDMAYQQAQAEPEQQGRMTVSANTSSEGTRSLTVNAEGDMADELAQLLSLSGLASGRGHQEEMGESAQDEFHANTRPEPTTFALSSQLNTGGDLNRPKAQHPAAAARGDNPLTR